MRFHYLKTWPVFFRDVKEGRKLFEIRLDDRKYEVDDVLILLEWDPEVAAKECPALRDGYCVMGIGPYVQIATRGI